VTDLVSHIEQAKHNEKCAYFLMEKAPEFRDWAITAAFYAAVHLVEACFTSRSEIGHTEVAQDRASNEEKHRFRSRKVRELANNAYPSYRKLFEASYNVRYLTKSSSGGQQSAIQYYDEAAARKLVHEDLVKVRTELEKAFELNLK
jgi:hypothetical protein